MAIKPDTIRAIAALAAVLGIALLAPACGGSSPAAAVADIGTTGTSTNEAPSSDTPAKADPAKFASCMRSHGVKDFPDPDSNGNFRITGGQSADGSRTGIDPDGPQWQAATASCKQFAPNGGKPDPKAQAKMVRQALAFSACMRSHGVTGFPDPEVRPGGGMLQKFDPASGVDPSSPTFQAAQATCQKQQPDGPKMQAGPGGEGNGTFSPKGGDSSAP
jgi:hypothetical protein